MCQAWVDQQPLNQIWQFAPLSILWRKASGQIRVCRVFPAEPRLSHQACVQENVQENDWKSGQVSGSGNEEMWIYVDNIRVLSIQGVEVILKH